MSPPAGGFAAATTPALSESELAAETAEALPDREALSTVVPEISGIDNFAMPINEAFALNYYSTNSIAVADAHQTVIIGQSSFDPDPAPTTETTAGG